MDMDIKQLTGEDFEQMGDDSDGFRAVWIKIKCNMVLEPTNK
jgi:hypothetical protein